ncbi:MAG: flotillin domain-containing protein [Xenococcaceae cyanobacterium MO_167.B27]|nr:flotillin domain-containing protein [Xenococcaceae cyanobacterium MO_167.B27]
MLFWLTLIQSLDLSSLSTELVNNNVKIDSNKPMNIVSENPLNVNLQPNFSQLGGALLFPSLIGALIVLLLLSIWAYTRVYVITPNNEAFVRTGGVFIKKKSVILNGGCIVLPGFHELTRVPLREISIDVERTDNLAVRTQDYLRANMRVTFYVCINANEEDVLVSAARLSKQGRISENDIKEALEKRADDAIRAAAKRKSIAEIDSDKLGFADEVLNLIQQDLKKVGLTLNNIAISEIEESDTYDENNFFDAQGVKLRTETIQRSIKQKLEVELTTDQKKKELELNTQIAIQQQELTAEKQSLNIKKEKEDAKFKQLKEVEFLKAQTEREIQESKDQEITKIERNKILQSKAVEEEKIQQELAVQQSRIEAEIALEEQNKQLKIAQALQQQESEVAEINRQKTIEESKIQQQLTIQDRQIAANIALEEKNKELKIAQALQQQESEVAEINRQKIVEASRLKAKIEVAQAEQESQIAQQEAAIAIAEKERERLNTEAERAQAESAVVTATEIEQAEREQRLSIIAAEQEAQQLSISDRNVVELDVFRRQRQAEIARQAAELEAESIRTLAEANQYKALAEAEGKKALIEAENTLNNANRTAELVKIIWPELAVKLPEIVKSLAPQPGVLGDTKIYAFPGGNGNNDNGIGDINKLLLSTSGLSLIETLLNEGKLAALLTVLQQLLNSKEVSNSEINQIATKKTK